MEIQIRGKDVELDQAVQDYIESRVLYSLDRFTPRITRVSVQILDLNGPRGGQDKGCRIEVQLRPSGRVFVRDTDAHVHAAVDRAVDRLARVVGRTIEKTRSTSRTGRRSKPRRRRPD